jgi:hypothetical protein
MSPPVTASRAPRRRAEGAGIGVLSGDRGHLDTPGSLMFKSHPVPRDHWGASHALTSPERDRDLGCGEDQRHGVTLTDRPYDGPVSQVASLTDGTAWGSLCS